MATAILDDDDDNNNAEDIELLRQVELELQEPITDAIQKSTVTYFMEHKHPKVSGL